MMITTETLEKMIKSFVNEEEYAEFLHELMAMAVEINFVHQYCERHQDQQELLANAIAKALCMFSSFAKDHIEPIKGLINTVDYQMVAIEEEEDTED